MSIYVNIGHFIISLPGDNNADTGEFAWLLYLLEASDLNPLFALVRSIN